MKFRKLKAEEISAEIAHINRGGVKLLLWKGKFATIDVLNETFGDFGWTMSLSNDNRNCEITVSDEETGRSVTRVGIGDKDTPKSLGYDAISAAGTAWGIGRELFTAPDLFIPKESLPTYSWDEEKKTGRCNERFKVLSIEYADDRIHSVTIGITEYGKVKAEKTFVNDIPLSEPKTNAEKTTVKLPVISDDEIILIGWAKGRKYGDIKNTSRFKSLLQWAANTDTNYPDDKEKEEQLIKLAALGKALTAA